MWWPYIPWLLFLIALTGALATHRLRHRHQQHLLRASPSVQRPDKFPEER
jgi:hypothetical protein